MQVSRVPLLFPSYSTRLTHPRENAKSRDGLGKITKLIQSLEDPRKNIFTTNCGIQCGIDRVKEEIDDHTIDPG